MKKIILSISLSFALSISSLAQNDQDFYQKGKSYLFEKKYTEAISAFNKVLETDKENQMVWYYRGLAHYYEKQYDEAIYDFTQAILIYPTNADFYYYRALAKKAKSTHDGAYKDFSNAIFLDSISNADYFFQRAEVSMNLGNYKDAIYDYHKTSQIPSTNQYDLISQRKTAFGKLPETEQLEVANLMAGTGSKTPKPKTKTPIKKPAPIPDDAKTLEAKKYIAQHQFTSLEEGKTYYSQLQSQNIPTAKKSSVLALLRAKVLKDVIGNEPYKEDLDNFQQVLNTEDWLLPEGRNYYFNLIQNSKYVFSGGVQKGKIYYNYRVTKSKNAEKYRLLIYGVNNNESNLVFDSWIHLKEDSTKRIIDVYSAEIQGYRWAFSTTDFLRAEMPLNNQNPIYTPVGAKVQNAKDVNNTLPKDKYTKLITATDASSSSAIKATLQYIILDYTRMLHKPSWW
jgi:tetratricopeptide (TPR) repeat protein